MSFPTEASIEYWNSGEAGAGTMGQLMDWAGFNEGLRAAVLVALESDHDEHYRSASLLTDTEVEEVIGEARINGQPLGRMAKSKVRVLFQAIRTAAGTLPPQAAGAPSTPPAPIIVTAPTELTASSPNAVALNGVTTQVGNVVVPLISDDAEKTVHRT